jgi:hypothetical protein
LRVTLQIEDHFFFLKLGDLVSDNVQETIRESAKAPAIDGKPMPFDSDPRAAWNICLQRSCAQLYGACLWKCPALAYRAMMSRKLKLDEEPAWQLFRDYHACTPTASDSQLPTFLATEDIQQCSLCPARKIAFRHRDPTVR